MAQQKTSEAAAQAPSQEDATLKRSVQMKWFTNKTQQAEVALAYEKTRDKPETWQVPVGQIVGMCDAVNVRRFEDSNGEVQERLYAVGEFEAVNYATGEVIQSPAADLPGYYIESLKAALDRNEGARVLMGVEIVLTATGKSIPYAYEVKNLVPREPDSPINRLKAAIAKRGKLRLPPPVELKPIDEEPAEEPATA